MGMQSIARRDLEVKQGASFVPASVELFAPEFTPATDERAASWKCHYAIDFGEFQRKRWMGGEDSYQALQLAISVIPVEVETSPPFKHGNLYLWGEKIESAQDLFGIKPLGEA